MILDPYEDELDDHHPPCLGGCGQLADECMCNWVWPVVVKRNDEEGNDDGSD